MKIRLSDIPATGLEVNEVIPFEGLNQRLAEGNSHGIQFTEGLDVALTVYKSPSGAETKGFVKSRYRQPCARCVDGVEREINLKTNFILQQRPVDHFGDESEQYEDDIGITYYDGDHIDLDDLIEETIILSLSIYWHPDEDEKGRCVLCKRDVQKPLEQIEQKSAKGTSLADLLKKAGI